MVAYIGGEHSQVNRSKYPSIQKYFAQFQRISTGTHIHWYHMTSE